MKWTDMKNVSTEVTSQTAVKTATTHTHIPLQLRTDDPRYSFFWWRVWEPLHSLHLCSNKSLFILLCLSKCILTFYIAVMQTFCWFLISGLQRGWASAIALKKIVSIWGSNQFILGHLISTTFIILFQLYNFELILTMSNWPLVLCLCSSDTFLESSLTSNLKGDGSMAQERKSMISLDYTEC